MTIEIVYQQTHQNYTSYFTEPLIVTITFTRQEAKEATCVESTAEALPLGEEVEI